VLKPGGRIGLSDITREPGAPGELSDLMAWIACLADARPAEAYAYCLAAAGFRDMVIAQSPSILDR
jgi:arsenite methyltransferase